MTIDERRKLVFHGTSYPPYTESLCLRQPRSIHPFFVADNPKAAMYYASAVNNDRKAPKSVFVLKMKEAPLDIAFDFKKPNHINKLREKLPKTVDYLESCVMPYKFNFYEGSVQLAAIANILAEPIIWYNKDYAYIPDESMVPKSIRWYATRALLELGLFSEPDRDRRCQIKFPREFLTNGTKMRRFIKSKIYEEICNMGYMVVMDGDTTGKHFMGHEFAVFDLDVFEEGFTKSLPLKDIRNAIEYAYPRNGRF